MRFSRWLVASIAVLGISCAATAPGETSYGDECTRQTDCGTGREGLCRSGTCDKVPDNAVMEVVLSKGTGARNKLFRSARLVVVESALPSGSKSATCPGGAGKEVSSVTAAQDPSVFNLSSDISSYDLATGGDVYKTGVTMIEGSALVFVEAYDVVKTELTDATTPIAKGCWQRGRDQIAQCGSSSPKTPCLSIELN